MFFQNLTQQNIIYLLLFLIVAILLFYKIKVYLRKRTNKKRFKRGVKLEKAAAKFLEKKGFKILGEQVAFIHKYKVNGKSVQSELIVDYYVRKGNRYFVVEVKSGKSAVLISNKNTRRQILEYRVAIPCDGVFLLDMENKNLQEIEFDIFRKRSNYLLFILLILCILILFTFTL